LKISIAIFREEIFAILSLLLQFLLRLLRQVIHTNVLLLLLLRRLLHLPHITLFLTIFSLLLLHLLLILSLILALLPSPRTHILLLLGLFHHCFDLHLGRRIIRLGFVSKVAQSRAYFFGLLLRVMP
jgi:hypothetical protein